MENRSFTLNILSINHGIKELLKYRYQTEEITQKQFQRLIKTCEINPYAGFYYLKDLSIIFNRSKSTFKAWYRGTRKAPFIIKKINNRIGMPRLEVIQAWNSMFKNSN